MATVFKPRGWLPQEDSVLRRVVASHGSCNWAHIASEFNAQMGREGNAVTARTGKQCRERFMHHLRPDIQTGPWTEEEDLRLIEEHKKWGNRWKEIAKVLPGRTEGMVKNRWNSTARQKCRGPGGQVSILKRYIMSLADQDESSLHERRNPGGRPGAVGTPGSGHGSEGQMRSARQRRANSRYIQEEEDEEEEEGSSGGEEGEEEELGEGGYEEDAGSGGEEGGMEVPEALPPRSSRQLQSKRRDASPLAEQTQQRPSKQARMEAGAGAGAGAGGGVLPSAAADSVAAGLQGLAGLLGSLSASLQAQSQSQAPIPGGENAVAAALGVLPGLSPLIGMALQGYGAQALLASQMQQALEGASPMAADAGSSGDKGAAGCGDATLAGLLGSLPLPPLAPLAPAAGPGAGAGPAASGSKGGVKAEAEAASLVPTGPALDSAPALGLGLGASLPDLHELAASLGAASPGLNPLLVSLLATSAPAADAAAGVAAHAGTAAAAAGFKLPIFELNTASSCPRPSEHCKEENGAAEGVEAQGPSGKAPSATEGRSAAGADQEHQKQQPTHTSLGHPPVSRSASSPEPEQQQPVVPVAVSRQAGRRQRVRYRAGDSQACTSQGSQHGEAREHPEEDAEEEEDGLGPSEAAHAEGAGAGEQGAGCRNVVLPAWGNRKHRSRYTQSNSQQEDGTGGVLAKSNGGGGGADSVGQPPHAQLHAGMGAGEGSGASAATAAGAGAHACAEQQLPAQPKPQPHEPHLVAQSASAAVPDFVSCAKQIEQGLLQLLQRQQQQAAAAALAHASAAAAPAGLGGMQLPPASSRKSQPPEQCGAGDDDAPTPKPGQGVGQGEAGAGPGTDPGASAGLLKTEASGAVSASQQLLAAVLSTPQPLEPIVLPPVASLMVPSGPDGLPPAAAALQALLMNPQQLIDAMQQHPAGPQGLLFGGSLPLEGMPSSQSIVDSLFAQSAPLPMATPLRQPPPLTSPRVPHSPSRQYPSQGTSTRAGGGGGAGDLEWGGRAGSMSRGAGGGGGGGGSARSTPRGSRREGSVPAWEQGSSSASEDGGGMDAIPAGASASGKRNWTDAESDLLVKLVEQYGEGKWSSVAHDLNKHFGLLAAGRPRTSKQCRERYMHHLSPSIRKEGWTREEEEVFVEAHKRYGNRWSEISRVLPGRTENSIKNHWNTALRRKHPARYADMSVSLLDQYQASNGFKSFPPASMAELYMAPPPRMGSPGAMLMSQRGGGGGGSGVGLPPSAPSSSSGGPQQHPHSLSRMASHGTGSGLPPKGMAPSSLLRTSSQQHGPAVGTANHHHLLPSAGIHVGGAGQGGSPDQEAEAGQAGGHEEEDADLLDAAGALGALLHGFTEPDAAGGAEGAQEEGSPAEAGVEGRTHENGTVEQRQRQAAQGGSEAEVEGGAGKAGEGGPSAAHAGAAAAAAASSASGLGDTASGVLLLDVGKSSVVPGTLNLSDSVLKAALAGLEGQAKEGAAAGAQGVAGDSSSGSREGGEAGPSGETAAVAETAATAAGAAAQGVQGAGDVAAVIAAAAQELGKGAAAGAVSSGMPPAGSLPVPLQELASVSGPLLAGAGPLLPLQDSAQLQIAQALAAVAASGVSWDVKQ